MPDPRTDRPHMPGYGVRASGDGLLEWSWAQQRLLASRSFWLATSWPDGRPHLMPVWAVWDAGALWFSTGLRSRKARNLLADPRCAVTTEDASSPVVVEGVARFEGDSGAIARVTALLGDKYDVELGPEFHDPDRNATISVTPRRAFGLADEDLVASATRWTFDA
ncbi:MAG TPA: pyridoxamine 5'-phosphate oxidase family protein [Solirubrobacteraceae bacterium]|jgi:PPOX class probable F420-dependent enzyme|nr:pyridoxamine 5'-phosphate oxidase family protein [Solirubrobacteraceae bacterium]